MPHKYHNACVKNKEAGRAMVGIVVLAAGFALVLRSMGLYSHFIGTYIFKWQMILMVLGIMSFITHANKGPGLIFFSIGLIFYLRIFFDFNLNVVFGQVVAGAILLILGFAIIFMRRPEKKGHNHFGNYEEYVEKGDEINEVSILSGGDRSVISDHFKGGRIIAFFGGTNLNLKGCTLAPGKNYLDVIAIFGGMKLIVPEDWNVRIQTIAIFGGFSDKRYYSENDNIGTENVLIIKGIVLFGGGEIKR